MGIARVYVGAIDVAADGVGDLRLLARREHRVERVAQHRGQQARRVAETHEAAPDSGCCAALRARLGRREALDEVVHGDVGGSAHEHLREHTRTGINEKR